MQITAGCHTEQDLHKKETLMSLNGFNRTSSEAVQAPPPASKSALRVRFWCAAWQEAERIFARYELLFLLQGFVGGQLLLALVLGWLHVPRLPATIYWITNGFVMGTVLALGYRLNRRWKLNETGFPEDQQSRSVPQEVPPDAEWPSLPAEEGTEP